MLTVNTDFAQVEVDEQQVNLTRFACCSRRSVIFSSKAAVFSILAGACPVCPGAAAVSRPWPRTLFYSRRIGLNLNRVIPIDVGGRVTGKVGLRVWD